MIRIDEDALVCDLMETYGIIDYRSLPIDKVATFSVGLRENSRIKLKLSGFKVPYNTFFLASIYDNTNLLLWSKTKDGERGINVPKSIAKELIENKNEETLIAFDTPEDFDLYRDQFVKKGVDLNG